MPDSGAFPDGNIVVNNCSRMNKKLISHCPVFKLCNSITIFWSDVQNESSLLQQFHFRCADGKLTLSVYIAIHSYVASVVACVLMYLIFAQH